MADKTPSDYEAYLFDWDGTLAKTLDVHLSVRRKVLEKYGRHVSDQELALSLGKLDKALEEWGLDVKIVGAEMDELATKGLPGVDLYPGAVAMLKRLKNVGKKTALITASPHSFIADVLDRHDVRGYFDVIIAADDVENLKPHPESLQKAMETLGVSPDSTLMLGDSDKDIVAAKNANVDSLLFYPDSHKLIYNRSYLASLAPTHTIGSWEQLVFFR